MNKARRTQLNRIQEQVARLVGQIEDLKSKVEVLLEQEQEAFDNMPESFQEGEKGERAQEAINAIQNIFDGLESAETDLDLEGDFDEATA